MRFLLRPDMPPGFRENTQYPELSAAVQFLSQYQEKIFEIPAGFRAELKKFPDYLKKNKVPEGSDRALREGLLLERVTDGVFNVVAKSDENPSGKCWFGSFGPSQNIERYFERQRQARQRQIEEDDDTP